MIQGKLSDTIERLSITFGKNFLLEFHTDRIRFDLIALFHVIPPSELGFEFDSHYRKKDTHLFSLD